MEQKSNNSLKVILALSVVVNIALGILLFNLSNTNQENEKKIENLTGTISTQDQELKDKVVELTTMKNDLERIKAEREQLGLKNEELDGQISQLNSYLTQLKKTSKLDAKKRAELEQMIAKLREDINLKDAEIAQLRTQNDSLRTDVSNLTTEKQKLGDSLHNTAKELAYASILKAEGIKVTVLKENGKELEDDEYKHKVIDRIKIAFKLADNKAAKKNNKRFFVTLVPPSGKPFCDTNNGGGFCTLSDGNEVPFTLSQDLEFNNTGQLVTFTMFKGFNYTPGAYKVIVYSEGYEIGQGGFNVK